MFLFLPTGSILALMTPREEEVLVVATSELSHGEVIFVTLIPTLKLCQALPWCLIQTFLSSHTIIVTVTFSPGAA